jgi:hypothetical protein
MTEAEWLAGTDPLVLLAHVHSRSRGWRRRLMTWLGLRRADGTARKARLFACACCRLIWPLLVDERLRRTVETAERYADGVAPGAELNVARTVASELPWGAVARAATRAAWDSPWDAALQTAVQVVEAAEWAAEPEAVRATADALRGTQSALVRDLFGNPFRPPPRPGSTAWADATALEETWAVYQKHDFAALPRLADRLQASGCPEIEVLEHFRAPGPHARGCWGLDRLLGKEE